jgi:hypothetical protein
LRFFTVTDRVAGDVRDMFVGKGVHDFPTAPLAHDESCASQNAQVLRYERLRHIERVNELVHTRWRRLEPPNDAQAQRMRERSEQRRGAVSRSRSQPSIIHADISIHA